jgi:hypothetical protein
VTQHELLDTYMVLLRRALRAADGDTRIAVTAAEWALWELEARGERLVLTPEDEKGITRRSKNA